jgi:hypothetical protein
MNVQQTKDVFADLLKEANVIGIIGIVEENHDPHPFHIDEDHKAYARDTNEGELDETILEMFPCSLKDCKLNYTEHKAERKLMLELKKDLTQQEAQDEVLKMQPLFKKHRVFRIAFVEGEGDKKYKFIEDGKA